MSKLLQIQEHLLANASEIAQLERALAQHPSRALSSSLKSLYKLRSGLESEFQELAADGQVDVVSYRLFEGRERPTMALVGRAMDSFQTLYAILYAAVNSKRPRDTARLSSHVIQESSFDFAYAFSGSVGFVFTMPNDRLLLGHTDLDQAMMDLFLLARSSTRDDIRRFARKFGFAAVRAVHRWADALCASRTGADIQWKKADITNESLVLQPPQVEWLRDLIATTTDVEMNEITLDGVLLGFDYKTRRFRFAPEDGSSMMRGRVADRADLPPQVTMPRRYRAQIKTVSKVLYSAEDPDISHELQALLTAD